MSKAGLKLVPGSGSLRRRLRRNVRKGLVENAEEAVEIADKIGYPVGIKAVAGGGGRGIRIAYDGTSLMDFFHTVRAEAQSAFGSTEVYVEKWIENARHIEVQILGDNHGNVIHLGERECSIQRKHQKLVEEAPAASLSSKTRHDICKAAAKAAKSIGYNNAGTIEFVVDTDEEFYFLEMNTRIQVEHTVTEMTTGIDLLKEQIRLAWGEELGYSQSDVEVNGHAIECRINAEDPDNGLTPSPGQIEAYLPPGGNWHPCGWLPLSRLHCPTLLRFLSRKINRPRQRPSGSSCTGCGGLWMNLPLKALRQLSHSTEKLWTMNAF